MAEPIVHPECAEAVELMPEFALGALDRLDSEAVRKHVGVCPPCRRELGTFEHVVDALLLSPVPASPSVALRDRVLAAAGIVVEREPRRPLSTVLGWLQALLTPAASGRASFAFAAVALLVALGVGYQLLRVQSDVTRLQAENASLRRELLDSQQLAADVLGPGAIVWILHGTEAAPQARANLYCRPESKVGVLAASELPALSEGRTYQLWLIKEGKRTSGGLLAVDSWGRGTLTVQAPERFGAYDAVGMTVEPSGGSSGPTGQRVLAGEIY